MENSIPQQRIDVTCSLAADRAVLEDRRWRAVKIAGQAGGAHVKFARWAVGSLCLLIVSIDRNYPSRPFLMLFAFLRLFARLPLHWFHRAGVMVGWLMYWSWPTHAKRLRDNLRASAICSNETEYCALLRESIRETGKAVVESVKVWFGPDRDTNELVVECQGWAHVEGAQNFGKGVILITPHLGCFEIAAQYIAQRIPLTVLYRPPRKKWIEPLIIAGRTRKHLRLAPTNRKGVQLLLKSLRNGQAIGLLPDQAPNSRAGVWADFFGRPAYTMSLTRKLQRSTGAALISAVAERLPCGAGFRLQFEPVATESFDESKLNRVVEDLVRQCPGQYMWSYNRHKVPRLAIQQPGAPRQAHS